MILCTSRFRRVDELKCSLLYSSFMGKPGGNIALRCGHGSDYACVVYLYRGFVQMLEGILFKMPVKTALSFLKPDVLNFWLFSPTVLRVMLVILGQQCCSM
jgi:hypothetical protein